MAPLVYSSFIKKVLLLYFVFFFFTSIYMCESSEPQIQSSKFLGRRKLFEFENKKQPIIKNKSSSTTSSAPFKNQTKLVKPARPISSKNQTKLLKPNNLSTKEKIKVNKTSSINSTKKPLLSSTKIELKKLNSSSQLKKLNSTSKPSNFTKISTISSLSSKKTSDLTKLSSPKNKTAKPTNIKLHTDISQSKKTKVLDQSEKPNKIQISEKKPNQSKPKKQSTQPIWLDQDDEGDLVSEFTGLPTKFQQTLIPDLERISTTSKIYLTKANKEITKNVKPYVGNKYASTIASIVSFAFILIPLLIVSLVVNRIKAYFSFQKLLIFIQVYLSIYFAILCLSSLASGLEPLKFFYTTSKSTYLCLQVLQMLGYVLYLLLLLMYLILVFSTNCGLSSKLLGLAQTFVGFAIGLHYYVAVFHRVVLSQPPKTNWKIHGIYSVCFFVICLSANAERRKKAYLEESGEEGKKN